MEVLMVLSEWCLYNYYYSETFILPLAERVFARSTTSQEWVGPCDNLIVRKSDEQTKKNIFVR